MKLIAFDKLKAKLKCLKQRLFPPKVKAWVVRDGNKLLTLFEDKPTKDKANGVWLGWNYIEIDDNSLFPEIKWEDEEATEVELTIKIK